jgi:hypothetical protein
MEHILDSQDGLSYLYLKLHMTACPQSFPWHLYFECTPAKDGHGGLKHVSPDKTYFQRTFYSGDAARSEILIAIVLDPTEVTMHKTLE